MTSYQPVLVTGPADPPLSLEEAKLHLRVEHDDEDGLIQDLVGTATSHIERILGIAIIAQTWRMYADEFEQEMYLPYAAASVASVKALDSDGLTSTVSTGDYALLTDDTGRSFVRFDDDYELLTDLAETKGAIIEFVSGVVPQAARLPLKQAVRLLVGHWYAHREAVATGVTPIEVPMAVQSLIGSFWQPRV